MYKKISILIILAILLSMLTTLIVFSDITAGWEGYGIYTLTDTDCSVVEENVNLSVMDDKLVFEGRYVVKNNTSRDIKVVLATPYANMNNIKATIDNSTLKHMIRTYDGIKAQYNLGAKIPNVPKWYAVDVYIKPNESKSVLLTFDSSPIMDEQGTISVSYLHDRNSGYCNQTENVNLTISLADYKPYNIIELIGVNSDNINEQGILKQHFNKEDIEKVAIKFNLPDKIIINNLADSKSKAVKEIADLYESKDYQKMIEACNQFINESQDNSYINHIKLVKAEGYRLLFEYENYLKSIQAVSISNIPPLNTIYKVLFDKLIINKIQDDQEGLNTTIKEITDIAQDNNPFMISWLNLNGFKLSQQNNDAQDTSKDLTVLVKDSFSISELYKKIIEYKYSLPIALLIGIILGFIIGRATKRTRRSQTTYLFRR